MQAATRIPRRSLERLESGHLDGEVDGFARGFVRTVAEAIGLDPDDAVARMLSEPVPAADAPRPVRELGPVRPALWLGGLLLLAALALAGARWAFERGRSETTAELVQRRDPVRALAEAERVDPPPPPAPAGSADPRPPPASAGSADPRPPPAPAGSADPRPPPASAGSADR